MSQHPHPATPVTTARARNASVREQARWVMAVTLRQWQQQALGVGCGTAQLPLNEARALRCA